MSPADSPFASAMSRKSRHDWQAAVRPETAVAASTVDVFSPRPNKYWWPGGRNPVRGKTWLQGVLEPLCLAETTSASLDLISAPDWPARRRKIVEGVLREAEVDELPDDDIATVRRPRTARRRRCMEGCTRGSRGFKATLAPYLPDRRIDVPSLLTRWHSAALARLPGTLRALAARMLRRMVRSPGFLARFILDDPGASPRIDEDDDDWTLVIHRRYRTPPATG